MARNHKHNATLNLEYHPVSDRVYNTLFNSTIKFVERPQLSSWKIITSAREVRRRQRFVCTSEISSCVRRGYIKDTVCGMTSRRRRCCVV